MTTAQILDACISALHHQQANSAILAHRTGCTLADVAAPSPDRQRAITLMREATGLPAEPGVLRGWLDTAPTADTIASVLRRARLAEETLPL